MTRISRLLALVFSVTLCFGLTGCGGAGGMLGFGDADCSSQDATIAAPIVDGDLTTARGDTARTGVMPGPLPLAAPCVLWRSRFGAIALDPPAVAGDLVYVPTGDALFDEGPGALYALDTTTGKERWKFDTGSDVWGTPAVAADIVYTGSADGNLYALDAATGAERWRVQVGPMAAAPAVVDGVVYLMSGAGLSYNARGRTMLRALDAATGAERWVYDSGDTVYGQVAKEAMVAVSGGLVLAVTPGGILVALDEATGQPRWTRTNDYDAGPAVAGGMAYVVTDQLLTAIDISTGRTAWTAAAGYRAPAVWQGLVYVSQGFADIVAFDAVSGTERWRVAVHDDVSVVFAPVVVAGSVVIAYSELGNQEELVALDAATGQEQWRRATKASSLSAAGGRIFIAGDKLVALGMP